eukprot:167310-Prorocentrum_lima.AAC.1
MLIDMYEHNTHLDWQGHMPLICKACYIARSGEEVGAIPWRNKCNHMWHVRRKLAGLVVTSNRQMSFQGAKR